MSKIRCYHGVLSKLAWLFFNALVINDVYSAVCHMFYHAPFGEAARIVLLAFSNHKPVTC